MKLNIGSHSVRLDGYLNVDILELPNVDIVMDITKTPWQMFIHNTYPEGTPQEEMTKGQVEQIDSSSVDEILMVEVLEHLSFHDTNKVLCEIYRVLKPGGKIHIQVPDCGSMMEMYVNKEVCACVPHKPASPDAAKAKADCFQCNGKGKVNPNRWLMAFCGAQKYGVPDIHKNIFTAERLQDALEEAGFSKVDFKEDPLRWKLKVNAQK